MILTVDDAVPDEVARADRRVCRHQRGLRTARLGVTGLTRSAYDPAT